MNTTNKIFASVAVVALAAFGGLTVTPVSAQLANASASTLGKGGNATATARGMEALSVNPAGLGMPGSGFSLSLIPIQVRSGLDPIALSDLKDVEGTIIGTTLKEDWLSRVNAANGQSGSIGVDITELALSLGRIGFQVSTIVGGQMSLSPDIMEAALYGNAGRTGTASDLSFSGSTLEGFAVSTAAMSFGLPIASASGDVALGATLKYSVGHGVAIARDQGGSFRSNPLGVDVSFPIVHTDDTRLDDGEVSNGSGVGLDLGFQMKKDKLSFGAAVLNAVSTFAWDESTLVYRPGTADLSVDDSNTDFEAAAYSGAPAGIQTAIEDLTFQPTISVGGAYDVSSDFTVSADVRNRLGEGGIATGPKFHAGVGAEFRGLSILHLRGGAAVITDGMQFGGGASLILGPVSLSAAGALQTGDLGEAVLGQFTLSFGGR
jgi:hypothetical protein